MVNIPYRSSEALLAEHLSVPMAALRRTIGAVVLALIFAVLLGLMLEHVSVDGDAVQNLVPLDDPALTGLFTA
jgi:hypothetical protein